jgi:glycolate oxidase iron-sulfur subunit
MQTQLSPEYQARAEGRAAEAILRKCVHCGFCTATCPTYQLLGDELDGPRGRIYLMKQVLEGAEPTRETQMHLDRCLTCRNCETTCPSGVDYGHLIDIGRKLVDEKVPRSAAEKAVRWLLKEGLPSPLFGPAMKLGQLVRPLLPASLQNKVPAPRAPGPLPTRTHARRVLLLAGCVQPAMMPSIHSATARVLDAAGDQDGGRVQMRANIDAWWPLVNGPDAVEAIVMNASGCGVTVKEYGHILKDDPAYAAKAARISELTQDLSELLPALVPVLRPLLKHKPDASRVIAFHPPCTLQHGQKLKGGVEQHLAALGFTVQVAKNEAHLCCGSAGTYSVLNPELAYQLRDRKLGHLGELQPSVITSANIGCITHLQSGTTTPVQHWVEVLDDALST